jgi:hypothetical protein
MNNKRRGPTAASIKKHLPPLIPVEGHCNCAVNNRGRGGDILVKDEELGNEWPTARRGRTRPLAAHGGVIITGEGFRSQRVKGAGSFFSIKALSRGAVHLASVSLLSFWRLAELLAFRLARLRNTYIFALPPISGLGLISTPGR